MNNPLTPGQRALLTAELEQRHRALGGQLDEHLHGQTRADRAHEVMVQDGDDEAQRRSEREVAMTLTDRERRELDAVAAALARLQHGTYGMCADCGTDIPFDRLKAEPWAMRCVACESRHEAPRR
jgi:DnaK suppressor protein